MVWTFPSEFKLEPFVVLHLHHVTYLEKVIWSIFIKPPRFRIASDCALVRTLQRSCLATSSKFRAIIRSSPPSVRFRQEAPKCFEEVSRQSETRMNPNKKEERGESSTACVRVRVLRELEEGTRPNDHACRELESLVRVQHSMHPFDHPISLRMIRSRCQCRILFSLKQVDSFSQERLAAIRDDFKRSSIVIINS
ncbi:hypothetical protein BASA83_007664 [Batrachochytrium salamandrivorans]|nr:hypothetical protein BASA83_007664 [Batrachochytrium salamandrivorans]